MGRGLLQGVTYAFHILEDVFPDQLDLVSGALWDNILWSEAPNTALAGRIDQLTTDVQPVMCHSHNDYWRREPLYQAIRLGCTGVEADLWFLNNELNVAHTALGIRENRTLQTLYLNPIMEILDRKNIVPDILAPEDYDHNERVGVFDTRPKQSLVLLVDFKNEPEETWNRLVSLLTPFHDKRYLTFFNGMDVIDGPLTIVASGKAPFNRVIENSTYRNVFYDAPLGDLDYLASTFFSAFRQSRSPQQPLRPRAKPWRIWSLVMKPYIHHSTRTTHLSPSNALSAGPTTHPSTKPNSRRSEGISAPPTAWA